MFKYLSIDPGKCKCGLVLAEISEKKVYKAIIIKSEFLADYVRNLNELEDISKIIIGYGTTSRKIIEKLDFKSDNNGGLGRVRNRMGTRIDPEPQRIKSVTLFWRSFLGSVWVLKFDSFFDDF